MVVTAVRVLSEATSSAKGFLSVIVSAAADQIVQLIMMYTVILTTCVPNMAWDLKARLFVCLFVILLYSHVSPTHNLS